MTIARPRRWTRTGENDSRASIVIVHREFEQLVGCRRTGDPRNLLRADAAVAQRWHPAIPPPSKELFESIALEPGRPARSPETNINEDRRLKSAPLLDGIDGRDQLARGCAPPPEAPREHG